MRIKRIFLFALATACATFLSQQAIVFAHSMSDEPQTVTLVARKLIDGVDNYTQAAFSFKYGINGDASLKVTRNNWDLLFGNSVVRDSSNGNKFTTDTFDVTTVVDDCSRIKDLGEMAWSDSFRPNALPAFETPTRESSVRAIVGHMYLVHSKDHVSDHYALFRVESLEPGARVTITWKLIESPQ